MTQRKENKQKEEYLSRMFQNNIQLTEDDINQISTRYKAGFYSLAFDYVWKKLRTKIKEFYSDFNPKFISTLIFLPSDTMITPFTYYDAQIIFQLGIITKKEYQLLLKGFLLSQNILIEPKVSKAQFEKILELSTSIIFSKDYEAYKSKLFAVGEKLLICDLSQDSDFYNYVTQEKNRYYSTTIKYLLYSYETCPNKEILENNLTILISNFWSKLTYEEKLQLSYVASCNENNSLRSFLKHLLNTKDSNVISDCKNVSDIVIKSKRVISSFYSYRYKQYLSESLYDLDTLSTVPENYSNLYVGSALLCLIGPKLDNNMSILSASEKVISKVKNTTWQYYFNMCFNQDMHILLQLAYYKDARIMFSSWIKKMNMSEIVITNPIAQKILTWARIENYKELAALCRELLKDNIC